MRPPTWLESAVERLDVALLLIGADRKVSFANGAAHRLLGVRPGLLDGLGVDRLVTTERRGELRNFEDVLNGGGARRVRSVVRREDGSRVDVTMAIEPCLDEQGQVAAVSVRYEVVPAGGRATLSPARSSIPIGAERPLGASLAPPRSAQQRPSMRPSQQPGSPQRRSEQRLSATRTPSELELRLHRVARNLQWLEERLCVPSTVAPLDDARERARAMLVVGEARGLVGECLDEYAEPASTPDIPAPPKLPRL